MTESRGIRKRFVLESVDQAPRSVRAWAAFLKTTPHVIKDRARRMGGIPQALQALKDGTAPKVFSVRLTKGECKRGHKIEGDNVLIVNDSNTGYKDVERCRKCYRKGPPLKIGEKRPGNQKPRDMCNAGLHKMEGDNVYEVTLASGRKKRRCVACKNQYMKRRLRNLKMGILPRIRKGQTLWERIEVCSERQPNGCVLWTGKLGHGDVPYVNHKDFAPSSSRPVTVVIWEKREGKSIPEGYTARASCGNKLCIAEDQLELKHRTELVSKDSHAKRWVTRRKRYQYGALLPRDLEKQRDYVREGLPLMGEVRRTVATFVRLREDDIDDVMQLTLLSLQDATAKKQDIGNVAAYMRTCARRHAIDTLRSYWSKNVRLPTERLHQRHAADDPDYAPQHGFDRMRSYAHTDPALLLEEAEQEEIDRIALKNRMNAIPPKARRVYILRAEGLTNYEVAARLGRSVNTIEQQMVTVADALRHTPKGQKRRALLVPLDLTRHHYGISVRRNEKEVTRRLLELQQERKSA
jgi:RNA polymerase sigma factor (sigma-70 family)